MYQRRLFACQMVLIGLFALLGVGLLATSAEERRFDCQWMDCKILDIQALVGEVGDSPPCCLWFSRSR